MKTRVEKIDKAQMNMDIIDAAGQILRQGGLVAFPTETVYGLGANALDEEAARKTYAAKGRPSDNPLIVHIADLKDLYPITKGVPEKAVALAEKFWPGPLTMIFEKSEIVPHGTTGGLDTVAVRMPDDTVTLALIKAAGGYVSGPSANTSGRPSPTTAQHVLDDLDGKINMILDGGPVHIGVESTIVDMTVEPPMILRPGAVTKEMLEETVGEVSVDHTILTADSKTPPKAPGMKYRHYAPRAEMTVVEGSLEKVVDKISELAAAREREGHRTGIIATRETMDRYTSRNVKCIGTREDESTVAANLYAILRDFDDDGTEFIYSEAFASDGIGSAVMNRLLKAAGHHVINV
ncbi:MULTISPECIES: L-threonylcarbamoyladenylate synthase [Clostridia]|uniref:Threonylcarbamoyl-AMP synthase n=1 Tax=Faecalicatena fissicatena TaxID=290055 RepID=A0ABS2EA10_9FIRM|nr:MULTISPECIES: L-threonylcarbamoyladenylate synthase [Clostridia]MBM6738473.1 threonylcarbamoyl-AMP synthase [Faecalicatena fissicatena]HIX98334.1 threonylcarbamoyl-AMP synthase [Candidatus Dorea intestinigallinarum]